MRVGQPVWHVVTGESCTGVITELKDAGYGYGSADAVYLGWYARVAWLGCYDHDHDHDSEEEDNEDWFDLRYLRKVGEEE